jgi:AcrR family transcriptional regulator
MPRPSGARNHDFEVKRTALLDTLTEFALNSGVQRPSLRQFAMAAKQSEPTLRHYFVDRQGLVIEIIRNIAVRSEQIWALVRAPAKDPAAAVSEFTKMAAISFREGMFARSHAFALVEGLADRVVGRVYLESMLEPSLNAFSQKLAATPGGPRDKSHLLAATLAATGPLFMLALHQNLLEGREHFPMETGEIFGILDQWIGASLTPPADL